VLRERWSSSRLAVFFPAQQRRTGRSRRACRATRAQPNALAKTGSIANVRAVSGYVRTRDGGTLAFSILANNFTIAAANVNRMPDLAVETLANYSRD
jgi:D-alanyl-D-alanine carboxypeptidase/D-alanyl-D-alanine-endopeptidase (penicillin-binding protein 4)